MMRRLASRELGLPHPESYRGSLTALIFFKVRHDCPEFFPEIAMLCRLWRASEAGGPKKYRLHTETGPIDAMGVTGRPMIVQSNRRLPRPVPCDERPHRSGPLLAATNCQTASTRELNKDKTCDGPRGSPIAPLDHNMCLELSFLTYLTCSLLCAVHSCHDRTEPF